MQNKLEPTPLILVRHGQAQPGSSGFYGHDAPLSELGRRQAAAVAACLVSGPAVDAVYSSNLPRALETASSVAEQLGLELTIDERLAEFDVDMSLATPSNRRPDLYYWLPDHAGIDGETLAQFSSRVSAFHEEVVDNHPGHRVVIISHAGTIEMTIRWSLGVDQRSPWQYEFAELQNASVTEIELWPQGRVTGGAPRYSVLKRIGDVAHLGDQVTDR